jgi:hypothetical protein
VSNSAELAAAADELRRCLSRAAELIGQLAIAAHTAADAGREAATESPATNLPLLMNAEDTAKLLAVNVRLLDQFERRGELSPVRLGRAKRWALADIEKFLAARRQAA